MISQLDLSSFSEKAISLTESTRDFRPWDKTILDWEIKYHGYVREEGGAKGFIECHVTVEIKESVIQIKSPKIRKKFTKPGYKLSIFQNVSFEGKEWDSYIVYEEEFEKQDLKKAFDVFQRELLNVQGWVKIAESRARIIPKANDVFECIHCGWVPSHHGRRDDTPGKPFHHRFGGSGDIGLLHIIAFTPYRFGPERYTQR